MNDRSKQSDPALLTRAEEKIARARTRMLLGNPWWATLLLMLRTSPSEYVPTMGTDGTNLHYNPAFVDGLTDKECMGVLMHEVAHCSLLHPFRRKWRDPLIWNLACDQACNALLQADGIELPKGGVPPGPLDKTAEELYEEWDKKVVRITIPQDVFAPGEMKGADSQEGSSADSGNAKAQAQAALGKADDRMTEDKWRDALASARGLEPGGLSRIISQATEKEIDWRAELAEFISSTCKSDYHTWNVPSRRVRGMPGWKREPQSTIAICIDTSGSITGSLLDEFVAECKAITRLNGISAILISADAAVHQVIEPGDEWPTAFEGGGGTSFVPALRLAEEKNVDGVVYMTDSYGDFPPSCKVPVLWALSSKEDVPFGKKIYLKG